MKETLEFEVAKEPGGINIYKVLRKGLEVGTLLLDTEFTKEMEKRKTITIK